MLTYKELNTLQAALTVQISNYKITYDIIKIDREKYVALQKECLELLIKLDWEIFDRYRVKSAPQFFSDQRLIDKDTIKEVRLSR